MQPIEVDKVPKKERDESETLVYSVPKAGSLAGLGKNASYAAVRNGSIPAIRVGGRLVVPKKKWHAILNGEAPQ